MSARHSTHVDYNEGGKMINLCGRYVAYSTPILAICCLRIGEFSKVINRKCIIRRLLSGIIIGWSGVWLPYFLLYVFSPGVEQSTSWLTGIRAAENAGFTNFGIELCLIYSICILFILVVDYRISIGIICVLMCVNSFAAILTCEKYHSKDFEYSKMMKELFSEYQNDTIAVLCTNSADYENLYGKWLFYQVGHKY